MTSNTLLKTIEIIAAAVGLVCLCSFCASAHGQLSSSSQSPRAQQLQQLPGRGQGGATVTVQQSASGSTSSSVNTLNPTVQVQGNYAGSVDSAFPGNGSVGLTFNQAIQLGLRYNLGNTLPSQNATGN